MTDRPECAECPLLHVFAGQNDAICCEIDPTTPRCESCGVPYVKHLGVVGTCAEKTRYLSLLRRVIRMSCLTVERCRGRGELTVNLNAVSLRFLHAPASRTQRFRLVYGILRRETGICDENEAPQEAPRRRTQ